MATSLWAARLAEFGIRVHEIRPGIIETDLTGPVKAKYDTLTAEGITPSAFPFSTGDAFEVDGGFHMLIV